jgi:hypothetical protein
VRGRGRVASGAVHRSRLPRHHRSGRCHRPRRTKPSNWENDSFNLPARLRQSIPKIGPHETIVLMHNDAVVRGLSEVPFMQDVRRWGILTIGTGLGNARFTNYWERSSDQAA